MKLDYPRAKLSFVTTIVLGLPLSKNTDKHACFLL